MGRCMGWRRGGRGSGWGLKSDTPARRRVVDGVCRWDCGGVGAGGGDEVTTWRKILDCWTEAKFVVRGEVKQTTCCCADPGGTSKTCRLWSGNKTNCRCNCHRIRKEQDEQGKTPTQ
jgi:hypothetical protein